MRDFKEVPSFQWALEDVSPNPRGAVMLGKVGEAGTRRCLKAAWARPHPAQGVLRGHLADQQHSPTGMLRHGANSLSLKSPSSNIPVRPVCPHPLSSLTEGAQALHMKEEPKKP